MRLVSKVTRPSCFSRRRTAGLLKREAKDPFSIMVEPLGVVDGGTKALLPNYGWLNRYLVLLPGMSTQGVGAGSDVAKEVWGQVYRYMVLLLINLWVWC